MTHGSATVPDPLHPLHRDDVGACELPLPRELEPVAFAMSHSVGFADPPGRIKVASQGSSGATF